MQLGGSESWRRQNDPWRHDAERNVANGLRYAPGFAYLATARYRRAFCDMPIERLTIRGSSRSHRRSLTCSQRNRFAGDGRCALVCHDPHGSVGMGSG